MSPPSEVDVEVVRARLSDFPGLSRFRDTLSSDEAGRAAAYKMNEPRDAFTLARGLLRIELGKRLGLETRDIHFDVRPSGKPDVRRVDGVARDWRFSVSHTGSQVAIAFALGVEVGIDIERLDRPVEPLTIARRYFAPEERRALEALPKDRSTRAFFAGWTRKEAVVKARGHTMAESLTTLTVDLDPDAAHPKSNDAPETPSRPVCRLAAFEFPQENLIGAVAVLSERVPRLAFRVLSAASFD